MDWTWQDILLQVLTGIPTGIGSAIGVALAGAITGAIVFRRQLLRIVRGERLDTLLIGDNWVRTGDDGAMVLELRTWKELTLNSAMLGNRALMGLVSAAIRDTQRYVRADRVERPIVLIPDARRRRPVINRLINLISESVGHDAAIRTGGRNVEEAVYYAALTCEDPIDPRTEHKVRLLLINRGLREAIMDDRLAVIREIHQQRIDTLRQIIRAAEAAPHGEETPELAFEIRLPVV